MRRATAGATGVLARYLNEETLETTICEVLPVFPQLPAVNEEDVEEAFKAAGLTWLRDRQQVGRILHDTSAAYSSLQYRRCGMRLSVEECTQQLHQKPFEHALFLGFDNSPFSATLQYIGSPYRESLAANIFDPTLGWWNLPVYEEPRQAHWTKVEKVIVGVAATLPRPPNKVVLLGDHAKDVAFVELVKTTLWKLFEYNMSVHARKDPERVAARGAAELASRIEDVWYNVRIADEVAEKEENMELK